jgi:hypothetical protein
MSTSTFTAGRERSASRWPLERVVLVLPVLYTLHCLEEFTRFLDFCRRHAIHLPLAGQAQLFVAMLALLAVILGASLLARRARGPGDLRLAVWFVVFAMMYSHALLNVVGVVWAHEYAPGAVIAGALYLPYGVYVCRRAWREGWLSATRLVSLAALGAGTYVGMVVATLALGRALGGT